MADRKLSELTALIGTASGDQVYIRDISAAVPSQSKSITITELLKTFFADMTADIAGGPAILNEVASGTNPTLIPFGADKATGIGSSGAGSLSLITNSLEVFDLTSTFTRFGGTELRSVAAAGPSFLNENSTTSNPTLVPNQANPGSGIGSSGASLDLIVDGESRLRIGTGVGNPNVIFQPSSTSGLLAGSVSGSFGLHNVAASATVPTLLPSFLDETTGIGLAASALILIASGTQIFQINSGFTQFFGTNLNGSATGAWNLENQASTATNPTLVPNRSGLDSGIGGVANTISIITSGVSRMILSLANMTKGNIYVADGATLTPLAVGANDEVLTADSGEATGVRWGAAGPSLLGRALFADGQWGYWSAGTSADSMTDAGVVGSVIEADTSSILEKTVDGVSLQQTSAASAGSDTKIHSGAQAINLDHEPILVIKFKLGSTTDIRFFAGLSETTSFVNADDIGVEVVGVQYSTARPDTNWQFIAHDGTTQTTTDSGVAVDTLAHYMMVDAVTPTSVKVSILDAAFVELASTTFTTGLPAGSKDMGMSSGIEPLAAVAKTIDQFHGSIVLRNT